MLPSPMAKGLLQETLAYLKCYLEELFDEPAVTSSEALPGEIHEGETEKAVAPRRRAVPGLRMTGHTDGGGFQSFLVSCRTEVFVWVVAYR
jgi:hypothetical protein